MRNAVLRFAVWATTLAIAAIAPAEAGRPLNVDDASILARDDCQLEAFVKPMRDRHEINLQPACNVGADIEWALPLVVSKNAHATHQYLAGLHGKTAFKPLESGRWGWGASAGVNADIGSRPQAASVFAALLFSVIASERITLHANAGANRVRGAKVNPTWSGGGEYALNERSAVVAEAYGERGSKMLFQLGARHWLQQDVVQIDASIGGQRGAGRNGQFITLGITIAAEKLLRR